MASQAGVSLRLVAEFERGQRNNVSLESALRLLKSVGITVVARAPHGPVAAIFDAAYAIAASGRERPAGRVKKRSRG